MRTSFELGRISGIPVRIHLNWFLPAVLVTWTLAVGYFPQLHPGWSQPQYWLAGMATALLFFVSVLLHELGHSWTALSEGVPVQSITLFIFGGVAQIGHEPETPGSEFKIVFAGPLTSLLLAGLFFLARFLTLPGAVHTAAEYLFRVNIILAVFNLMPGFPLDGGRLLRSILWKLVRSFDRATRWATNIGLGTSVLLIGGGLGSMAMGNLMGGIWIVFVGGYLGLIAYSARGQSLTMEEALIEESTPEEVPWIRPADRLEPQPSQETHRPRFRTAPVEEFESRVTRIEEIRRE